MHEERKKIKDIKGIKMHEQEKKDAKGGCNQDWGCRKGKKRIGPKQNRGADGLGDQISAI
jgi:hypothetical protein